MEVKSYHFHSFLLFFFSIFSFFLNHFHARVLLCCQNLFREGFVFNMPAIHLGWPHWISKMDKWDGLGPYFDYLVSSPFIGFSPQASLSLNISSPRKPFPVPPGRNIASCFFSEQLLGTRHTVLQTGGRNKPEAPDACSDPVYILMGAWTVGSTGTNGVTGWLQINIMVAKLCCGKEDCHESNT